MTEGPIIGQLLAVQGYLEDRRVGTVIAKSAVFCGTGCRGARAPTARAPIPADTQNGASGHRRRAALACRVDRGDVTSPADQQCDPLARRRQHSPVQEDEVTSEHYWQLAPRFWRAHRDLGTNWSLSLEIGAGQTLTTRGIYRWIRHPMYASQLLYALAQALLLPNWIAGPAGLVAFLAFYLVRIPQEERMMRNHFGDAYRAYCAKTGRILPRLRGLLVG